MRTQGLILFLIVININCKKSEIDEVPACIHTMISEMRMADVTNPPSSVYEYEYNGKMVYLIPPKCCDIPSILYDQKCNVLCNPDGGISGKGDGRCPDFFEKRKNERLIWKDERE